MRVKLDDVIARITGNVDRFNTDLEYYVGGEHYDYASIAIYNKGLLKSEKGSMLGFKFHFPFQKGDTLFMARNPHLKKAGMVTYDGICSDASYVLRTKDHKVLLPEFLPLIIQNDLFWAFFEANKSGSVNYLMNWKEMRNYEFELPSIERQKAIADMVWAAERTRKAYISLVEATDELVKSQFIEMFGSGIFPVSKLSDECELITKGTTPTTIGYNFTAAGVNFIKIENIDDNGKFNKSGIMYISEECNSVMRRSQLKEDDILFSIAGAIGRCAVVSEDILPANINQALAIIRLKKDSALDRKFVVAALQSDYVIAQYMELKRGVAQLNLSLKNIGDFTVPVPPLEDQRTYVALAEQSDKSKFELQQSIKKIEVLIKSIISQNE